MDLQLIRGKISEYRVEKYSEAKIEKIKNKLNQLIKDGCIDKEQKDAYFLKVFESIFAGKSLYLAQNAGCFRFSKFSVEIILELSRLILKFKEDLTISEREICFLEGVGEIKKIFDIEMKLTETLKRELKEATNNCKLSGVSYSYIMSLCTYVEHLVVEGNMSEKNVAYDDLQKDKKTASLKDFSIEEIISAMGLVISIYNDIPGFRELPNFVFVKHVGTKRCEKVLLLACKIRFLQELQQANEIFGYKCEYSNGFLSLKATVNRNFLQDYRLGYIKRQMSNMNYNISKEKISFMDIIEESRELFLQEKVDNPSRYRFIMPEKLLEAACNVGELTREEYDNINYEAQELNINIAFFNNIPIYNNLTLLEYLQLRRLFLITYFGHVVPLYEKYSHGDITKEEYFQSLIPCVKKDVFECLYSSFGEKVDDFWEINNYQYTSAKIIDLFYQPIISAGAKDTKYAECLFFLTSISTISNTGRNVFALLKRCNLISNEDGTSDPLISNLVEVFTKMDIKHVCGKKLGKTTDIDFAFIVGNHLYIAECKKNIHPTDIFESRTTIDALHKAERQLNRIEEEFKNKAKKHQFIKQNFGVEDWEKVEIIPFVITGNRIFSNSNEFIYPVRFFKELIAYIQFGTINIGGKIISVKGEGAITEKEMDKFLRADSPYLECFTSSMEKYTKSFSHSTLKICVDDYALNPFLLDEYCREHWNATPLNPIIFDELT